MSPAGLLLGLSGAIFFAIASILLRVGQRTREGDDGLFMTVFVNVVMFSAVVVFVTLPPWDRAAIIALLVGGVIGTVFGRFSNLRAIRWIGPTRANAFLTANPVVAAIVGWPVLGETVSAIEAVGGFLVIYGLLRFIRARGGPGAAALGPAPDKPWLGYLFAILAPAFFGIAFVVRKWGLVRYDSVVMGGFLGVVAAFAVIVLIDTFRGEIGRVIKDNFGNISWWFVAAGAATTLALLSQYAAFGFLPAWVVGILQSTQGLWTLALSVVFLGQEEHIDRTVVANLFLVVAGVAVIGIGGS
jgi:drug/metabolite transporter (DMT)-like permease